MPALPVVAYDQGRCVENLDQSANLSIFTWNEVSLMW